MYFYTHWSITLKSPMLSTICIRYLQILVHLEYLKYINLWLLQIRLYLEVNRKYSIDCCSQTSTRSTWINPPSVFPLMTVNISLALSKHSLPNLLSFHAFIHWSIQHQQLLICPVHVSAIACLRLTVKDLNVM